MATTPPIVSPLPAAPNRADAPADFSAKADAFVAALPPMVTQENSLATWMYTASQEVAGYVTAASNSATSAQTYAQQALASKNAAAQSVTDAAAQVSAAAAQANNAAASAAAAESAPGSIGNIAFLHAVALSF